MSKVAHFLPLLKPLSLFKNTTCKSAFLRLLNLIWYSHEGVLLGGKGRKTGTIGVRVSMLCSIATRKEVVDNQIVIVEKAAGLFCFNPWGLCICKSAFSYRFSTLFTQISRVISELTNLASLF